jgi:hypothetical protein
MIPVGGSDVPAGPVEMWSNPKRVLAINRVEEAYDLTCTGRGYGCDTSDCAV